MHRRALRPCRHALAPAPLRLPPGGSLAGYPRRAQLGAPRYRRTSCTGSARPAPCCDERGAGEHARACCGRLCKCVPSSPLAAPARHVTKDGSRQFTPPARHRHEVSSPRLKTGAARCGRVFSPVVGWLTWPVSVAEPAQPSCGDAESAPSPFGAVRPKASLSCRESWWWRGCASGFMAATVQQKQFPLLCHCVRRIPRGTNCFRLPALHCVSTASGAASPSPRRPDHNKDAMGANLVQPNGEKSWPTSAPSPQTKTASPARFAP